MNILELVMNLDENTKKNISLLQAFDMLPLKIRKEGKRLAFKRLPERMVVEERWANFFQNDETVEYIPKNFFEKPFEEFDPRFKLLENKILLISNHAPQSGNSVSTLVNFYNVSLSLNNTIIVVWDWDNHHHLHVSSFLAAVSDVYFPTHKAHNFELNYLNDRMFRMPSAAYQWCDADILQNIDSILHGKRISDVGGRFVKYGLFPGRNKCVEVLSEKCKNIGFLDDLGRYMAQSSEDKLNDWLKFKCQWIVPTLNDVSTRVFDALVTGNVIIIPERFRYDECLSVLHPDDCVYYMDADVLDPRPVVERAILKFDKGGAVGVFRRVSFGLSNNLDKRFVAMKNFISDQYIV